MFEGRFLVGVGGVVLAVALVVGVVRVIGRMGRVDSAVPREEQLDKLAREAKVAQWFCGAIAICTAAAFVIILVSTVLAASRLASDPAAKIVSGQTERTTVENGVTTVQTVGDLRIQVVSDESSEAGGAGVLILDAEGKSVLSALIAIALFSVMAWNGSQFFDGIARTRRPFEVERAAELMRVAHLALAASIAQPVTGLLIQSILLPLIGYQGSSSVAGMFDLPLVAAGCVAYFFARVFEYGCVLQDQDDRLL